MKMELALSGEEESDGPTTIVALDEGKIEGTGAEKVFTNEGTANECVPVCGAPDKVEGIEDSAPPESRSIAEQSKVNIPTVTRSTRHAQEKSANPRN